MTPRAHRLLAPLSVAATVLASTAFVAMVDPNQAGHYPLCPIKAATGLDCPACGGLRAVHSLAHGDLVGALDHNALVVLVVLPAAVIVWALWVRRAWVGGSSATDSTLLSAGATPQPEAGERNRRLVFAAAVLVVAFTVARNIDTVQWFSWLGSSAS